MAGTTKSLRRAVVLGWTLAAALAAAGPARGATPITDENDLVNYSSSAGSTHILRPGNYEMKQPNTIDISTSPTAQNLTVDNSATSLTVNNAGGNSALFKLTAFTLGAGTVSATAGVGTSSYGISASTFAHTGNGTLDATGGSESSATGIYVSTFIHTGAGTITATGGSGDFAFGAYGIYATTSFTHSGDGAVIAFGGSLGFFAAGISTPTYTHSGAGTLSATGGTGTGAYGMDVTGFTHSGAGSINATGGQGSNTFGIGAVDFIHNGSGAIAATGGSGDDACGINTITITHTGTGLVTAIGGTGNGAYGIKVTTTMPVDGSLSIGRQGGAASVYVDNFSVAAAPLTFGSSAVLSPAVNLDIADPALAAGLIQVRTGSVQIDSGAKVLPKLRNFSSLAVGQSREALFLRIESGGTILGDFTAPADSATIQYRLRKDNGDADYYLIVKRLGKPAEAVHNFGGPNAANLFAGLAMGLPLSSGAAVPALDGIYWGVDGVAAPYLPAYANRAQLGFTPHDATRLPFVFRRQSDAVQNQFERRIDSSSATPRPDAPACPRDTGPGAWTAWLNPLYQQSGHYRGGDREFADASEKFGGVSLGLARAFDKLVLGGELHYIRGAYGSDHADIDSDHYGVTVGGQLHGLAPYGAMFNPVVDFSAGYARGEFDQERRDYYGWLNHSTPKAGLFRAGLALGNRFAFGDRFALTPKLGADYMHIRQDGYAESNLFGLRVGGENYNSLRPKIGFDAEARATSTLSVTARAFYRYETMDRDVTLHSSFAGAPAVAFATIGHGYSRSSGNVGVGLDWRATDRLSVFGGYDMILEDKYLGHQANAGFAFTF